MSKFNFKNKEIEVEADLNIYPQETLEFTIMNEVVEKNIYTEEEIKEIAKMSSQTFMMCISA